MIYILIFLVILATPILYAIGLSLRKKEILSYRLGLPLMVVAWLYALFCISQLLSLILTTLGGCTSSSWEGWVSCKYIPAFGPVIKILSLGDTFGLGLIYSFLIGALLLIITATAFHIEKKAKNKQKNPLNTPTFTPTPK